MTTDAATRRTSTVTGVVGGVLFGAVGAVLLVAFERASWPWATVTGVLAGGFFGVLFGPAMGRVAREELTATTGGGADAGTLADAHRLLSLRPATRARAEQLPPGRVVPARVSALSLAQHRLHRSSGRRSPALLFGVLSVTTTLQAVAVSPWWALLTAVFVALLAASLSYTRWLRRRIGQLTEGQAPSGSASAADA